MAVKTHTFAGRKYKIEQVERIDGVTDVPGEPDVYEMLILDGNDLRSLHSALHEGIEALGLCDKCLHQHIRRKDGNSRTWDTARFLWRLGYRKIEE
jgi:hypothetical protein